MIEKQMGCDCDLEATGCRCGMLRVNEVIDLQGSKQIGLNRERLKKILLGGYWNEDSHRVANRLADAIIEEATLIEAKK